MIYANRKRSFTLVEIMIVIAIIALLSLIAIPNLLRQRLQQNESAAPAALNGVVAP
ncbi:MAG: prepilin-type N-terminal cleavage/methylation domain-containing protein [Candidatus Omnitrophota bacterium]